MAPSSFPVATHGTNGWKPRQCTGGPGWAILKEVRAATPGFGVPNPGRCHRRRLKPLLTHQHSVRMPAPICCGRPGFAGAGASEAPIPAVNASYYSHHWHIADCTQRAVPVCMMLSAIHSLQSRQQHMVSEWSQPTLTVLSSEADTISSPSLAKWTHRTAPKWPFKVVDSAALHATSATRGRHQSLKSLQALCFPCEARVGHHAEHRAAGTHGHTQSSSTL